jgi:opacity protein-like surface antigen
MKRIVLLAVMTFCFAAPGLMAQSSGGNHFEAGVFADYLRLSQVDPAINFVGVGGRIGFNLRPSVQVEGEMAYDFGRNFTTTFTNGVTTQFARIRTRPLTALFGPKFSTGAGPVRAFVTGKVGFVNFSTTNQNVPAGFRSAVGGITDSDTRFAFYPGGGIEAFLGPIGLRADIGDEIYFDNGAHNNLRVTFDPHIRF